MPLANLWTDDAKGIQNRFIGTLHFLVQYQSTLNCQASYEPGKDFFPVSEEFNKYEYHNMICEHDLSGLEMRILIRLSNCYGRDGLICPSNAKLAIWLGKITQEEYEKSDKTKEEQKKLESAKRVIKNAMKKLSDKKFIETERVGNSRKIFLLKPQHDKEAELIKYKGTSNGHPLNKGGHQMVTPGDQIVTPRASNDHPLIINNKTNNKINSGPPKGIELQASQIFWLFPQDVKADRKKVLIAKNIVKTGIELIGFDATEDLVQKISAESHPDYVATLENRINEVMQ